jgi:hypothetical protein
LIWRETIVLELVRVQTFLGIWGNCGEEDENGRFYLFTWIKFILYGIDLTRRMCLMTSVIGVGFLKGFSGINVDFYPSPSLVITKVSFVIRNELQRAKNKVFKPLGGGQRYLTKKKEKKISC